MAEQVIEGTWEEVVRRHDLRGSRVRVIVVDDAAACGEPADDGAAAEFRALAERWREENRVRSRRGRLPECVPSPSASRTRN